MRNWDQQTKAAHHATESTVNLSHLEGNKW